MTSSTPSRPRLLSVDLVRGLTIIGMIVVNYADELSGAGYRVFPLLLHAKWAGFHIADAVFPAFVTITGVSIALAESPAGASVPPALRKTWARALRLVIIGLLISNLGWLMTPADGVFRPLGVLQRIAVAYCGASLINRWLSLRWCAIVAGALLLLYWPLTLVPSPDGVPTDLLVPGANFSSWFDRAVFGQHIYVRSPIGFDPEGLLGNIPAIAQALIGLCAGRALMASGNHVRLAIAAVAMIVFGLLWGVEFPIVKALWSSSFVLLSSGITILLLVFFHWAMDCRRLPVPGRSVLIDFGVNSIFAYVLHQLFSGFLHAPSLRSLTLAIEPAVGAQIASLLPILVVIMPMWLVVRYMRRRNWIVKV